MEQYDLATLHLSQHDSRWALTFEKAKLMVIQDYGTRSWFIDVDGIADSPLLERFAVSEEIGVAVEAVTIGGRTLKGNGSFHPNLPHGAAAIRGLGELEGYAPKG